MPRKYENGNTLNKNYTKVENEYLCDPNLRAVEMGILTKLLSLPPNFSISIQGIACMLDESQELIRRSFNNLIRQGYMKNIKQNSRDSRGKFAKSEYWFSGKPLFSEEKNEEYSDVENDISTSELDVKTQIENITTSEKPETSANSPCMENRIRKTAYGYPNTDIQIRKTTHGYPNSEKPLYTSNNNSKNNHFKNNHFKNNHFKNNHFKNNHSINQNSPQEKSSDGLSLTKQKLAEIKSFIAEKIELESIQNGEFCKNGISFYAEKGRMDKLKK